MLFATVVVSAVRSFPWYIQRHIKIIVILEY